ncbi:MAG: ribosome small subunit-dependent GTPase A [Longimicrobiales bacterium]|nr:ribosome small subunit-dependent GTPase A [Longimicrobiales bacterium]
MVTASGGGGYDVRLDDGATVHAVLRGRLKQEARTGDRVVIGDRVRVRPAEASAPPDGPEGWVVEAIEPRRTQIVRRSVRERRPKVVAANVDRMLAVVAARAPEPRLRQLDRLLVIAEANGVAPVVLVNKVDLPGGPEVAARLSEVYRDAGYPVLAVSAHTGEGLEALRARLSDGVSALVGVSGVGKSSILNALAPGLDLRTGELSRGSRRGRHTTVRARLLPLPGGGMVADTPGFGDVSVWGVPEDAVEACFPEIQALAGGCRYRGCAHLAEPGCAVRDAIAEGRLAPSRWESYAALRGGPQEG